MATFTVWKFDDPAGAGRAADIVKNAASEGLVTLVDYAVVEWPEGEKHPKTHGVNDDAAKSGGWGALWGLLIGALFFIPVVGAVAGAAIGGLSRALSDVGIRKEDLEKIRDEVVPGTSGLFIITEQGDVDRFRERLHGIKATLVSTNLSDAESRELKEMFGG
ncbi:putative membrane protein [Isoptericola sp. CG 20/1183]|uniref:Membrane protein n=1 Tax=Isoptericola halotolerans TaxID=300560 RepID=A0ABX5ECG6_9MICO|nr:MULTISPECIES: DUF1269 domain-containing protein [Isoptericola]MCK0116539.1 DUF1269 domain-containing protein [Isoptericola sp. S6320L]PRZ03085.1 putative membrane protein [Isoptericola sp. CG 20/1183]PRZ03339.1 putative membrane protein [Isoptericola halotolerans]